MPIKDVGPKSLQKEEWNEYMTETNKKGMFRIESKKQMVTRVLPAMPAGPCRDTGTRKEEAVGSKREKCLKTRAPPPLCCPELAWATGTAWKRIHVGWDGEETSSGASGSPSLLGQAQRNDGKKQTWHPESHGRPVL